jgi:hypothetical protein
LTEKRFVCFVLGEPITAHVVFMDSGSDWISFNWTTSVEDCRQVLTGFWLGIVSTEQRGKQDSLQFISMKDCYCNLKEDQAIMFNTSTACQNWVNPELLAPSTKLLHYQVILKLHTSLKNNKF